MDELEKLLAGSSGLPDVDSLLSPNATAAPTVAPGVGAEGNLTGQAVPDGQLPTGIPQQVTLDPVIQQPVPTNPHVDPFTGQPVTTAPASTYMNSPLPFEQIVQMMADRAKEFGMMSSKYGKLRSGVFTFQRPPLQGTFFMAQRVHYIPVKGKKARGVPVLCAGEGCLICAIVNKLIEAGHDDCKRWYASNHYFAIIRYLDTQEDTEIRFPEGTFLGIFEKAAYQYDPVSGEKVVGPNGKPIVKDFVAERMCFRCTVTQQGGADGKKGPIKYEIAPIEVDKAKYLTFPLETKKAPKGITDPVPMQEAAQGLVAWIKEKGVVLS